MIAAVATSASYAKIRVLCKSIAEIDALPLPAVPVLAAGADDEVVRPARGKRRSGEFRPSAGMLRSYECYSPDRNEVVGISIWDSPESRDQYRLSAVESQRRELMAPFVVEERSGFYTGRELKIPRA